MLNQDRYHLVIWVFHMPTISGHKVFEAIKQAGPACQFLLFTSADAHKLPKFESLPKFLGIFDKTEPSKMIDIVLQSAAAGDWN